jgi:hypothetical protein
MNAAMVDSIVRAVLYEGYMLYPYRPSAVKNQQRFNFGVVYPRVYSEAGGGTDACTMQTECLVQSNTETQCMVRVRFLRMVARSIGKPRPLPSNLLLRPEMDFDLVEKLEINSRTYRPWQEAVEETIELTEFSLSAITMQSTRWPFRLSAKQERQPIRDEYGLVAGIILREKRPVVGTIELSAELLAPGVYKLSVRISNDSHLDETELTNREAALEHCLVSAHTILEARNGEFVSLADPPEPLAAYARRCQNVGTWPILVGASGERDTMLSSPIILYDYPEIAPESPGDLFDGAEIDEILSLRIMTMTDDEKREMRESDEHARQILERTEALPEEQWMKLHGAVRGLRAVKGDLP